MKALKYLVLFTFLTGLSVYLYTFRDQTLDMSYFPPSFKRCGQTITNSEHDYIYIKNLLAKNNQGWVVSFVSYAPQKTFQAPDFSINVLDDYFVVNYKSNGGYKQLVKTIENAGLVTCKSIANKPLKRD